MALTRLKNVFTSKTGRCLYVNSDDFDASDSFDNRGNSPNRPFKSIQRALLEAARFSYKSGQFNDTFESFSIVLYPGDYVIDNRPGLNTAGQAFVPGSISELSASSDVTLVDDSGNVNPDNILYKFNSVEGGVIVPRGTSIVGMDLRKTKLRPLYVPDAADAAVKPSAIFRVTGGCYFWQFSFFDGITQGVYKNPLVPTTVTPPTYSHHKLTCFEYADGRNVQGKDLTAPYNITDTTGAALTVTDLALYYQKVAKAWQDIPDSTSVISSDELQARVEENRIVGPNTAGPKTISSVVTDFVSTNVFTTTAEVTTSDAHGFSVGTPVLLEGVTGTDASRFNGSFFISAIPTPTTFRYTIKNPSTGAPSGNPTASGSSVKVEVDNVDSSSPYIFNCSLRSTWGMQGMHADGSKATGFKSMVVAQFTGVSLQKDDTAFIKWDGSAYIAGSHTDGDSIFKASYRNFHVKCSNDSVIQAVSVFAVGFADHFVAESGGDQSITNSNSNFGSCALRAKGFKTEPFTQDKAGTITHVIPPQKLARTYAVVSGTTFTLTFNNKAVPATNNTHGIVAGDYVRFGTADNIESYLISAVNGTSGELTLNRGYRNLNAASSGSGIAAYKGTISEIPVGYVALDVQKIQDNATQGNQTWAINQAGITVGDSRVNGGNAYLATAVAGSGSTAGAGAGPVHTAGTAVDNEVTWAYIGAVNTRLYLYGYTSVATKPPYKLQGFSVGARKQDKMYVSLIDGSTSTTFSALISPDGTTSPADDKYTDITVQGFTPGDTGHPLQYDTYHQNWYLRVTAATSGDQNVNGTTGYKGIHYHLGSESFYADSLFTGSSYTQRIADNRSSRDRTYRMRYTVDNSSALSREPINGYVIQPRNVPTGQSYADVYYIYDIQTAQELKKSVQDGIYYMTVLKGSISPTNGNLSGFSFAQNINNLYPTLDKDNPIEDPGEATSVASNVTVGLVETTNGSSVEDLSLSITKEAIGDWIIETRNAYTNASGGDGSAAGFITLEARDGETSEVDKTLRMVEVNSTGGTATELRRPSILRSGNHTFEYVGFGPGNYSTGLPSVQNRVLTDAETLLAQSQKEDGGIAFYSGLNSNGDLFIGNTRISAVTGEEASLDTPTLSIVGETANLRPVFDEIIIRDKITVENTQLSSVFKGSIDINESLVVTKSAEVADLTIKGEASNNEATKKFNVVTQTPGTTNAANTGDISFLGNLSSGNQLGYYWTGAAWAKFGLTDTGNLQITGGSASGSVWTDGAGDLQFKNGLGIDIQSTGTLRVTGTGATSLGGSLTVTGTSEFNGTVDVDANFAVRSGTTDKFTVASSSGNVSTSGTLTVTGQTDLNGHVNIGNGTGDNISIVGRIDTDLDPDANDTYDIGSSSLKWQDAFFSGTVTAPTLAGNVNIASGTSNFNNVSINGTLSAGNLTGNADTATDLAITGVTQRLVIQTGNNATSTLGNGTSNYILTSGGSNSAPTWEQNFSGNAATATEVYVTEYNGDATDRPLVFAYTSNTANSANRGLGKDHTHLTWNGSTNYLKSPNVEVSGTITAGTFGTSTQNAYGARTVSTGNPSGGSNGDIWYKY